MNERGTEIISCAVEAVYIFAPQKLTEVLLCLEVVLVCMRQ